MFSLTRRRKKRSEIVQVPGMNPYHRSLERGKAGGIGTGTLQAAWGRGGKRRRGGGLTWGGEKIRGRQKKQMSQLMEIGKSTPGTQKKLLGIRLLGGERERRASRLGFVLKLRYWGQKSNKTEILILLHGGEAKTGTTRPPPRGVPGKRGDKRSHKEKLFKHHEKANPDKIT